MSFSYTTASSAKFPYTNGEPYEPLAGYTLLSSGGYLLILSGTRENLRMALPEDVSMVANGAVVTPLVITAPNGEAAPALSGPGSGVVFGDNLKWRFRYKNSRTGEVSGLSELPEEGWSLGAEVLPGTDTWVGEQAVFLLPGTDFPGADLIELFRNVPNSDGVWLFIGSYTNPGAGESVSAIDNLSDEEYLANETAGLNPNPSFEEGVPWACAKAHRFSNGRVGLYGIKRHGLIRLAIGGVGPGSGPTIAKGDNSFPLAAFTFSVISGSGLDQVYRGFRVQRGSGLDTSTPSLTDDQETYRIVDVVDDDVYVYPPFESATTDTHFLIVDDRDARAVFLSEPGKPTNYDLFNTLIVGHNQDDPLLEIAELSGITYGLTRQRIYALQDVNTEEPSLSYSVSVMAEEGTYGLWSSAVTPFGIVFANERGVRVFDGQTVLPLGSPTSFSRFLPKTQLDSSDPAYRDEIRVIFDPDNHLLHVFYVPTGKTGPCEEIVFDPETGTWRGPWRRRGISAGFLRNTDGSRSWTFGDDYGNLWIDQQQTVDLLDTETETTTDLKFSLGSSDVISTRKITPTNLNESDVDNYVGLPIHLSADGETWELNWISHSDGTSFELENTPSTALAAGQYAYVGAIDWQLETAYLDAGEPVQPKSLRALRMRYKRPAGRGDNAYIAEPLTIEASAEEDGYVESDSSSIDGDIRESTTYYRAKINSDGKSFQLRLSGITEQAEPQITAAVADIDVRAGE